MNDAQSSLPSDKPADVAPWVTDGAAIPEHEGFLIGNRPGLELLKRKLDEALASGECGIEESDMEFTGIRVVAHDPRPKPKPESFIGKLASYGCMLILALVLGTLIVGLYSLWSWIRNFH